MTTEPGSIPPAGRRISNDDLTIDQEFKPSFGGAIGWTLGGTVIPGLGLWRSGHRVIGGIIMGVVVVAVGGVATFAVFQRDRLAAALMDPNALYAVGIGLVVLAVLWTTLITTTHLALRPYQITGVQRAAGGVLVGVLSFAISAPLGVAAGMSYDTAVGLNSFDAGPAVNTVDPWNGKDRVNILIMGGDSGNNRDIKLGIRPDSVTVASISTKTGAATLINVPRQTARMPFPVGSKLHDKYPHGFYDGKDAGNQEYALNAMYRNIPRQVPNNIFGPTKDFGAKVMMVSVGEALGLNIDYYVIINMDGFRDIINAIGGITVNVNDRVPIGGKNGPPKVKPRGWIEIGPNQHLWGGKALWFARGRYGTLDYKRMERQQCVINAVVKQADPMTVMKNYQGLMAAGTKTISTDVPRTMLPAMAELAMKAKAHPIRNVLLNKNNKFDTTNPDWPKVRTWVTKALADADAAATATPAASPSAIPSTPASGSKSARPNLATKSSNLDDSCGYHPAKK